jgi:hypothetical protein
MPGVSVARAGDGVGEVDEPDNVLIYLSVSQTKMTPPTKPVEKYVDKDDRGVTGL